MVGRGRGKRREEGVGHLTRLTGPKMVVKREDFNELAVGYDVCVCVGLLASWTICLIAKCLTPLKI